MCLDLIHPSPNSSQIYPPPPFPIYPMLGLLFLSLNHWVQVVLPRVLGAWSCPGTWWLSAYHHLSIASNSGLGWHFVPSSPFLLGFGLGWAGTGLGHAVTTAVSSYLNCPTLSGVVFYQLWLLHSFCALFWRDPVAVGAGVWYRCPIWAWAFSSLWLSTS